MAFFNYKVYTPLFIGHLNLLTDICFTMLTYVDNSKSVVFYENNKGFERFDIGHPVWFFF